VSSRLLNSEPDVTRAEPAMLSGSDRRRTTHGCQQTRHQLSLPKTASGKVGSRQYQKNEMQAGKEEPAEDRQINRDERPRVTDEMIDEMIDEMFHDDP
jgi:hypothetical protein